MSLLDIFRHKRPVLLSENITYIGTRTAYERARAQHAPSAHLNHELRQCMADALARDTGRRRVRLVKPHG